MSGLYYLFAGLGIIAFFYFGIPGIMNESVPDLFLATWGLITCYENVKNAERNTQ